MTEDAVEFDLIVIGMGGAGLSAATSFLDAHRDGARATVGVLERSTRDERGGSTRYTGSWFRVTADRELDPRFAELMHTASGQRADLEYCDTLARETPDSIEFLEQHGVEYVYFTQGLPNRNTGGGLGMPARYGIGIVEGLAAHLESDDRATLIYETEAVRLHVSNSGRVAGVVVRGADGLLRTIRSHAVVIASGGFEGDRRMLTSYLGERACDLPVISPGTGHNRGEGIRMAVDVGADTAGQFDMFHAEPVDPRSAQPDAVIYPYTYGIVVNRAAQRFFDEGKDSFDSTFEQLGYQIWRHQDQTAFLITDQVVTSIKGFDDVVFTDQPPVRGDGAGRPGHRTGPGPGCPDGHGRALQRGGGTGRVRPVHLRRQAHRGPDSAEVELGHPPGHAAVPGLSAHLRHLLHLRRPAHRHVGPRRQPSRDADPRPVRGRRGHRALLPQLPGGHVGDPRRHVREDRGCPRSQRQVISCSPIGASPTRVKPIDQQPRAPRSQRLWLVPRPVDVGW